MIPVILNSRETRAARADSGRLSEWCAACATFCQICALAEQLSFVCDSRFVHLALTKITLHPLSHKACAGTINAVHRGHPAKGAYLRNVVYAETISITFQLPLAQSHFPPKTLGKEVCLSPIRENFLSIEIAEKSFREVWLGRKQEFHLFVSERVWHRKDDVLPE